MSREKAEELTRQVNERFRITAGFISDNKEARVVGYENDAFIVTGHDKENNILQVELKGEVKMIEVSVEFEFPESEES